MRVAVARIATVFALSCLLPLLAQDTDKHATSVPRLVRLTGTFHPANGLDLGTTESATLSIYKDEQGGQALWQESQNVSLDANGQYTALLGITQRDGVPVGLFSSTEPRWLGVQFNRPGEMEQPRVQLVSVPYALKASDAETLGGKPASAYLLDPNAPTAGGTASGGTDIIPVSLPNPKSLKPHSVVGTMNFIPLFTDATNDLGNSVMYQSSNNIGIGTTAPRGKLDVPITAGQYNADNLVLGAGTNSYPTLPYNGWGSFVFKGATSDMRLMLQDGNGRINRYWNAYTDSGGYKYIVSGEPASREQMSIHGTTGGYWGFYSAPAGTAGGALMWTQLAEMNGASDIWLSPRGTNTDFYIGSSGAVGIGTAAPALKLDVQGGQINSSGGFCIGGTSCITSWPTGAGGTVTSITAGPGLSGGTITTSGTLFLNVGNANTWTNTQTFTANTNFPGSGIWNNAGNVGIGTTTPGSALDVAGDINFSGTLRRGGNPLLSISGTTNGSSTGLGFGALQANAGGDFNSAFGNSSLKVNTTGSYNAAMGAQALQDNTTGSSNTSVGFNALQFNTVGANNTAVGASAMVDNTAGGSNTASGFSALANNSSGNNNTAFGTDALVSNNTGSNNIAIGYYAAQNVSSASSYNIHIGSQGAAADNATIRIGGNTSLGDPAAQTSFFVAGVRGVTTGNTDAIPVLIDSAGQLGTVISSRRFKEDIQDMADASSGLMRLRPVTFRYQKPFADGSKPIQYGLIAEEVAEVYPDLVAHSADGQIETVKYQVLDSMLLNEVQRLNKENQALRERLSRLEAAMAQIVSGARQ